MAINDSIITEVLHILPNNDSVYYFSRDFAPKYKDTIAIKIPIDFVNGVGLNKIQIKLDRYNEVTEINEDNNSTTLVDLLINGATVIPVYPYEFAIVPANNVTLKASTANLFASEISYRIQIDTTDTFNSPLLKDTLINSIGGVIQWHPVDTLLDSVVYYWRISADSVNPASGFSWRESSFQYIPSKRGWEQAHFFQFKNDEYQYAKFNRGLRKFEFINDVKNIYCKNGIDGYIPFDQIIYKINGDTKYAGSWLYGAPAVAFAVMDPISGEPMKNYPQGGGQGNYGSITGYPLGHAPEYAFEFGNDSLSRYSMENFIANVIPVGAHVLAYSFGYQTFPSYPSTLKSQFETFGVNSSSIPDSVPYIFWGTKTSAPNPGTASQIIAPAVDSIIEFSTTLITNWNEGFIASPEIGPAASWDSLSWNWLSLDGVSNSDSIAVQLIGIKPTGEETTLASFDKTQLNISNLGSFVDINQFPKIRLVANLKDDIMHTPAQLDRWQVIYTPVPEAAINPVVGYSSNSSLQEGDNISIRLPIQNISEYSFTQDSLLVTYWIEDANRVKHPLPSRLKKRPFYPSEILIDTIKLNTTGYSGNVALWVEINPVGQLHSQSEQYHFNNIIKIPFAVSSDNINPLLDVTFDGIHILNNDIVSTKPNVLIQLKDENKFLALNDTSDFKIFIQRPGAISQRVYFGSNMTFIPASLPNNSCRINYTPTLDLDGTYQLLVQAKDKSDNRSGEIDYKINFEAVNRSTITEVMNYPNPFSTATHFVFTLTGSEMPSNFKIQIMTITGKVVREIFQDELGPLHIGRNITQFAWDGKDEFGDQLANGVYLYHVITRINGTDIEKRETDADQYFKKGWGKMYLMR
jgi:hypothetical protein